ncbi:MAG: EAL domain-containing protein [Candidatus Thiodiazotropha sp. (ex Myrtea sp. 'scaly one' KF741663)]|nr:EAL domain-containing protein [Candidatus Thiodiazotropha sp. (ex Myrtea sp. 'scaly one' KF741663)]
MKVNLTTDDNPLAFIGVFLLLIALLLTMITVQRIESFRAYHSTLANNTVDIVAHEILKLMDEKRRLLTLFSSYEAEHLEQLTVSPTNPVLVWDLEDKIFNYFPDSLAFTLANPIGELLINDDSELIDQRSRHDIFDFAAGLDHLPQIHSNPEQYFYDIMVRTERPSEHVLFVAFETGSIVERLRNSRQPSHQLLLINTEQENLIEITENGSRQEIGDAMPIVLTPEMQGRILADSRIPNTHWRLVDIADADLIGDYSTDIAKQAISVFIVFLISSVIMTWLTFRNKHRRKIAEAELLAAKGRLEYEIEERTQELRESKDLAEITLSSISDGVITTNIMGVITALNKTAEKLTGWHLSHIEGCTFRDILQLSEISSDIPKKLPINRCLSSDEIQDLNRDPLQLRCADGNNRVVQLSISEITGNDDRVVGNVLVVRDITDAHHLTHRISWQATHDALTGLINRLEFENRLKDALERSRSDLADHVLMYLDLDQFKVVNDTCGHIAGDELLKQVSLLLTQTARRNDTVARLGGDEFAILLEYCPIERALSLAEDVRNAIRDFRFTWDDKPFALGVSIGVVSFNASFNGLTQILSAADSACYAAKDGGRNRVHLYAEDDKAIEQRFGEMQWVSRIRQALDAEEFTLYGQRIIPLNDHLVENDHIEILLRLKGGDGELIMPGAFIPAAERYGMMIDIDRMVIQSTLAWLQESQYTGLVSINLSAQSMTDPNFLDEVFSMLCNTLTHPGQLLFEVTETAAITHLQKAQTFIERIRELGCRFALDDFGSGMSSFGYLKHLPVDHLKIDGSFIEDIVDDPINYAMVKAIQDVATTMQIKTVAEYVTNDQILDHLKMIGIDYGQGHGIEHPRPLSTIHTHLPRKAVGGH